MQQRTLLLLFAMIAVLQNGSHAFAQSEPKHTRQTTFPIPFNIRQAQQHRGQVAEVQLFVSQDQGQSWRLAGRVPPERGRFDFKSAGDGNYLFSLRTIDRAGAAAPAGAHKAGLQIIVDTVIPDVQIDVTSDARGQIVAKWQVLDQNIDPRGLQLKYQAGPNAPWKDITLGTPIGNKDRSSLGGNVSWPPEGNSAQIAVRFSALDLAGNPASRRVIINRPVVKRDERIADGRRAPINRKIPPVERWSADRLTDQSVAQSIRGNRPSDLKARPDRARDPIAKQSQTAANSRTSAALASTAKHKIETSDSFDRKRILPPGEHVNYVGTKSFNLNYDLPPGEDLAKNKILLWISRDGGKTWNRHSEDTDRRSPFEVRPIADGLYGFRISMDDAKARAATAPRSGDLPEVWVGVDTQRPKIQLIATRPSEDGQDLTIKYRAEDAQFAQRPITLQFARSAAGPWFTIATGLKNTGAYRWPLEKRLPSSVYLRLEARDAAGNIGRFDTESAISLRGDPRSVRIRGVQAQP